MKKETAYCSDDRHCGRYHHPVHAAEQFDGGFIAKKSLKKVEVYSPQAISQS